MKILVTGGAGYIGSHLVETLSQTSVIKIDSLVVYDNLSTGFKEALPNSVSFVEGDIRDTELLTQTLERLKIDMVIHLAAKLSVPESVVKPLDYYDNNVNGVSGEPLNPDRQNFESDPATPISPYGTSKLMGEKILRDCEMEFGLRSISLRYFNVAGAAGGQGRRGAVEIFGTDYPTLDGTCIRDYIHVDDLVDLHILAANNLANGGPTNLLNCGYGHGYSVRQVLETMKKVSNVDFKIITSPRRAGDPSQLIANCDKLNKLFNWKPRNADLALICKSALEWEKKK